MTPHPSSTPFVIDQAHLRRARNLSRESGRSVMAELEHLNNGTSDDLVRQVARLFGMGPIHEAELWALQPAFDLLPLALARCWHCLLFRDNEGNTVGVISDPFDPDLQLWLNSQARGAVLMRLASSTDLQAYLCEPSGDCGETACEPFVSKSYLRRDLFEDEQAALEVQEITRLVLRRAMKR